MGNEEPITESQARREYTESGRRNLHGIDWITIGKVEERFY